MFNECYFDFILNNVLDASCSCTSGAFDIRVSHPCVRVLRDAAEWTAHKQVPFTFASIHCFIRVLHMLDASFAHVVCSQHWGQALGIGTPTEREMVLFGNQTKTARIFLDPAEVTFSEQSVCSMIVLQPHSA